MQTGFGSWRQPSSERITGRRGVAERTRFLRLNPICAHCIRANPRRVTPAAEVDHIKPICFGGLDVDSNKQALCVECHRLKTAKDFAFTPKGCTTDGVPISGWPTLNATVNTDTPLPKASAR